MDQQIRCGETLYSTQLVFGMLYFDAPRAEEFKHCHAALVNDSRTWLSLRQHVLLYTFIIRREGQALLAMVIAK